MNNVKTVRREKHWTQAVLGQRAGVPLPTIRHLEKLKGRAMARLPTAAKLAKALDVPILRLFPTLPIPRKGEERVVFLSSYKEVIDQLDAVEQTRLRIFLGFAPDGLIRTLCNPFTTRLHEWPEVVQIIHGFLAGLARQARLDELIRELEASGLRATPGG